MPTVEITIDNPDRPAWQYIKVKRDGDVAGALIACILHAANQYADDPAVQRIADAIVNAR